MPKGSSPSSEDLAGPAVHLDYHQQQLALDFYARSGPVRVAGDLPVMVGPCPFEVEPFPWTAPARRDSLLLASVRLFRLAHQGRQTTPGDAG